MLVFRRWQRWTGMDRENRNVTHIFIVNPYAGRLTFAADLRKKLSEIKYIKYFVFNTRYPGHEEELVKEILSIFENEKLRFYCCGGSGTMRNVLNGFEDLSEVEIAFFPCGLTNDFLKMFGPDSKKFLDIEELINGEVVEVDYIKSSRGVLLNTFSTGLDEALIAKTDEHRLLRIFHPSLPYAVGGMYAMLFSRRQAYEVELEGKKVNGKVTEIFFGNGGTFGGNLSLAKHADVTDGVGDYRIIPDCSIFTIVTKILPILKGHDKKLDEISDCGKSKSITVRRVDGKPFLANQDGEAAITREWTGLVVQKGLHFVVPKGVRPNGR